MVWYNPAEKTQQTQAQTTTNKTSKRKHSANKLPGRILVWVLFISSIVLNIFNVYQRFAPAVSERFIATGILNFLFKLPIFNFLGFSFRVGAVVFAIYLVHLMRKYGYGMNPVWWLMFSSSVYLALAGIATTLTTLPFLLALVLVGGLQYLEIIFWNAPRRSVFLWLLVVGAYIAEIWMQYDMLPFHRDYASAWELVKAFSGFGFNWDGFQPVQMIVAAVGILGIEAGEKLLKIIERHG